MNLFFQLPISVADPSLPVIPAADIELLSPAESDAVDHWLLGVGDTSLVGIKSGRVLTPQGTSHTYNDSSVVVPAWGGALVSDIADDVNATICAVIKRPTQSLSTHGVIVFGSFSQVSWQNGSGLSIPNGASLLTVQYGAAPVQASVLWGAIAQGDYVFVAMSEQLAADSDPKQTLLYIGGGNKSTTPSSTARTASIARKVAFGNAAFDNASYKAVGLEIAEAIVFANPLTVAELDAVYARSKIRMAGRGITIE